MTQHPTDTPLRAPELRAEDFTLIPLEVRHADEMVSVLADPPLYRFTGGEPPTRESLSAKYQRQTAGAPEGSGESWLNWIVRVDQVAAGYVQATVTHAPEGAEASLAWVIGTAAQGKGIATGAATVMLDWLRSQGVVRVTAWIHPAHLASQRIAERLGLTRSGESDEDGEEKWSE